MALTSDLIALVHRDVPDPGPVPGARSLDDADYDAIVADLVARRPPGADTMLFAYGSLLWRPACATEGGRPALLRGWHRAFCIHMIRYRGMPDEPGLMMALDRGGSCRGVLQRLPAARVADCLGALIRREVANSYITNQPRWILAECDGVRVPALAFAVNRTSPLYVPAPSIERTADLLSRSVGHIGTGAEYLMRTVAHLESLGIHDPYLWCLQERVAARIAARFE